MHFFQVPACVGRRFFKFPADSAVASKWLQATGRPLSNFKVGGIKNLEIRSLHFSPAQYNMKIVDTYLLKGTKVPRGVAVLIKGSIPDINLNEQSIKSFAKAKELAARANRAVHRGSKLNRCEIMLILCKVMLFKKDNQY
jgi:hypothetical protein